MFIKLNFKTAQSISTVFSSIYYILKNKSSYLSTDTGVTNAIKFYNNVIAPGTTADTNVTGNINQFDISPTGITNCEIWNTNIGTLPECYYYSSGNASSLTFRFPVYDAPSTVYYSKITASTYQTSLTVSPTWPTTGSPPVVTTTTSTSTDMVVATGTNYTYPQTWSSSVANTYYSFWIYISPTAVIWAGNIQTYTKYGWPAATGAWPNSYVNGPFMIGQYTRLDVWNTDSNGLIPVCQSNGFYTTVRPFYGLSYQYDVGWGNFVNAYNFNPLTGMTAFNVFNILNATPNLTGVWSVLQGAGSNYGVSWGTNIRNFQDQTSLATTTNYTSASSAYTFTNTTNLSTSVVSKTLSTDTVSRSAWHAAQGAALYPRQVYNPNTLTIAAPTVTDFYRWPTISSAPSGSFILQPIVWNGAHYNVIGGLISDKVGAYLFNGDYIVGDEFTAGGITYSIWPLADGFNNRIGLAVPKR
jgi:hypothetical protein